MSLLFSFLEKYIKSSEKLLSIFLESGNQILQKLKYNVIVSGIIQLIAITQTRVFIVFLFYFKKHNSIMLFMYLLHILYYGTLMTDSIYCEYELCLNFWKRQIC